MKKMEEGIKDIDNRSDIVFERPNMFFYKGRYLVNLLFKVLSSSTVAEDANQSL